MGIGELLMSGILRRTKMKNRRKMLVKADALIAAEINRLQTFGIEEKL